MKHTQSNLDELAVRLACYEPAGETIELTQRDILGHTLVTGGSGSGKTTRIFYPMLNQLINGLLGQHTTRHSLVAYDTKGDGEVQGFLERVCKDAGREHDLVIINTDKKHACLDVLSDLPYNIEAIDAFAQILCSCTLARSNDTYWEMTTLSIIKQALRVYFLSEDEAHYEGMVTFVLKYINDDARSRLSAGRRIMKIKNLAADATVIGSDTVEQIQSTHGMWIGLAEKTKSIIRSMVVPLLDALNTTATKSMLANGCACRLSDAIACGKIVLISLDAIRYAGAARLIGCILKGQFYESVLARSSSENYPPAGIFLDDWLLSATGNSGGGTCSDLTALSMIRSRGGYVVAANQSMASLDLVIGEKARRAAFANFSNLFFFRSRDPELDAFAAAYLGEASIRMNDYSSRSTADGKDQVRLIRYEREVRVPAVPWGALARLPTGECYALLGNRVYDQPLCLVPEFSHDSEEIQ